MIDNIHDRHLNNTRFSILNNETNNKTNNGRVGRCHSLAAADRLTAVVNIPFAIAPYDVTAGILQRGRTVFDDIFCRNYFNVNNQVKPETNNQSLLADSIDSSGTALRKMLNVSAGTAPQNTLIIGVLQNHHNFTLLKILLGTSFSPGIIASLDPQYQLKQLLVIMRNFETLEKNHRLFIYDRLLSIISSWHINHPFNKKVPGFQGMALTFFCTCCLKILPGEHYPRIYDYFFNVMPKLAPRYCKDITFHMVLNLHRLNPASVLGTFFSFFERLLQSFYRCTLEAKFKNLLALAKILFFLPDNFVKRAAKKILLFSRNTMPKHFHSCIEDNIAECLNNELTHYPIVSTNFLSYYKIMYKKTARLVRFSKFC